jgi:hypothetical protein
MQYRIIVETQASGIENFYVQKKIFCLFWFYFRKTIDITMYKHKVLFSNIEDAKIAIQHDKSRLAWLKSQKIIKRQILNQQ